MPWWTSKPEPGWTPDHVQRMAESMYAGGPPPDDLMDHFGEELPREFVDEVVQYGLSRWGVEDFAKALDVDYRDRFGYGKG